MPPGPRAFGVFPVLMKCADDTIEKIDLRKNSQQAAYGDAYVNQRLFANVPRKFWQFSFLCTSRSDFRIEPDRTQVFSQMLLLSLKTLVFPVQLHEHVSIKSQHQHQKAARYARDDGQNVRLPFSRRSRLTLTTATQVNTLASQASGTHKAGVRNS
jgi:hypothetical protein